MRSDKCWKSSRDQTWKRSSPVHRGVAQHNDELYIKASFWVAGIWVVAFILSSLQVVFRWVYERSTRME